MVCLECGERFDGISVNGGSAEILEHSSLSGEVCQGSEMKANDCRRKDFQVQIRFDMAHRISQDQVYSI